MQNTQKVLQLLQQLLYTYSWYGVVGVTLIISVTLENIKYIYRMKLYELKRVNF